MKDNPKTRIAAAALAALIALTLAACGTGSSSGGSSGSSGAAGDAVTISYAYWDDNMTPAYEAAKKKFEEENSGITVELRQVAFDNYFTKLNTQIESKSAPDVFWLQNIHLPLYAANGALADLSDSLDGSGVDLTGIDDSAFDAFRYDDKLYALPWQVITFGLYYNKDLFDQANVDYPTADWTWEDFRTAAEELTPGDESTFGAVAPLWNYGAYYQTMYSFGADIISSDGKDTDVDSEAGVKAIDFWASMSRDGLSPSLAQITDSSTDQWFQSGKAAMFVTGSWNASVYAESLGDALGIAPIPTEEGQPSGAATTADGVFAGGSHIAEATKWAAFLSGTEGQTILNSTSGAAAGIPVDPAAQSTWLETVPKDASVFVDEIANTRPLPATKNTAAWEADESTLLAPAWNGSASAGDVAAALAQSIRGFLAKE